jgi:hypothetical protein
MAARLDPKCDERTRGKIRTSQLVNLLQDNALKGKALDPIRQRSAEILLRKSLPDLSQTELLGNQQVYVARLPDVAPNAKAWLDTVKPMLTATPVSPVLAHDTHEADNTNDINVLGEQSTS